jgi:aryl-alcohol dehydrogenase-like predicted oxidoreductase
MRPLDIDYIDLYLFHIRDDDLERAGEVRRTLEDLVDQGKIRLAMGLLSGRWVVGTQLPDDDGRSEFFKVLDFWQDLEAMQAMGSVLTWDGRSYVQAALGWIWARGPRTVPVPGFRTVEQVEEDVEAMRLGPISEEQMQEIRRLRLDGAHAGALSE